MPRLKTGDPFSNWRGLIMGRMFDNGRMTVTELADRVGVSRPTMRKYLNNPGAAPLDTVRKIHRVLGVRAEDAREALPMW